MLCICVPLYNDWRHAGDPWVCWGWQTSFFVFCWWCVGNSKKEVTFALIVEKVYSEGPSVGFLLKSNQSMRKDEPEKTKKDETLSLSFWVRLFSFFACTSLKNRCLPLKKMDLSNNESQDYIFLFLPSRAQKDEESRKKRFAIPSTAATEQTFMHLTHRW